MLIEQKIAVLITFFINGNPVFSNGPRSSPRNPPDSTILDNWIFDSSILTDKLFAKDLGRFAACLLNNNLNEKIVSSSKLPMMFFSNLKTT